MYLVSREANLIMHYHSLAKVKSPCPSEGLRPVSCYPSLQMNKCFTQPYQRCTVGTGDFLYVMLSTVKKKKKKKRLQSKQSPLLSQLNSPSFVSFILLKVFQAKAETPSFHFLENTRNRFTYLSICYYADHANIFTWMPLDNSVKQLWRLCTML